MNLPRALHASPQSLASSHTRMLAPDLLHDRIGGECIILQTALSKFGNMQRGVKASKGGVENPIQASINTILEQGFRKFP